MAKEEKDMAQKDGILRQNERSVYGEKIDHYQGLDEAGKISVFFSTLRIMSEENYENTTARIRICSMR